MPTNKRYPVVKPDPETLKYFRENPNISGMAVGAGLNGYPGERRVMVNPFAKLTDEGRRGLVENERLRHFMDETKPELNFDPTPEQAQFFANTAYGSPGNKQRLKETLVARILTGDSSAGAYTPAQSKAAQQIARLYSSAVSPTSPLSMAYQQSDPSSGGPVSKMVDAEGFLVRPARSSLTATALRRDTPGALLRRQ